MSASAMQEGHKKSVHIIIIIIQ